MSNSPEFELQVLVSKISALKMQTPDIMSIASNALAPGSLKMQSSHLIVRQEVCRYWVDLTSAGAFGK